MGHPIIQSAFRGLSKYQHPPPAELGRSSAAVVAPAGMGSRHPGQGSLRRSCGGAGGPPSTAVMVGEGRDSEHRQREQQPKPGSDHTDPMADPPGKVFTVLAAVPMGGSVADAMARRLDGRGREELVFCGPGDSNGVPRGARSRLSVGNYRRVYRLAVARPSCPGWTRIVPTTCATPSRQGKLDTQTFSRLLGAGEFTLGASLLLPIVAPALAGLGLAGFSAGLGRTCECRGCLRTVACARPSTGCNPLVATVDHWPNSPGRGDAGSPPCLDTCPRPTVGWLVARGGAAVSDGDRPNIRGQTPAAHPPSKE